MSDMHEGFENLAEMREMLQWANALRSTVKDIFISLEDANVPVIFVGAIDDGKTNNPWGCLWTLPDFKVA